MDSEITKLKYLKELLKEKTNDLNHKDEYTEQVEKSYNDIKNKLHGNNYFIKNEKGLKWFCVLETPQGAFYGTEDYNRTLEYIKEKHEKPIKEYENILNKINKLTEQLNVKFKYFNIDLNTKEAGRVLTLLNKQYNNPFKDLKGYTHKLHVLINHAINTNKDFYLQFKLLKNYCKKVYDTDLKKWV